MKEKNKKIIIIIIIFVILVGLVLFITNKPLKSDELPIKCDRCYINYPVPQTLEYKGNKLIKTEGDEQVETSIYKYTYNKDTKEITYYEKGNKPFKKKLVYYDDKIFILDLIHAEIEIGSFQKMPNNILDEYKKEINIDVSGYYQDEDREIYLSPDKRIFIGTKDGIQKGSYEILEFKTDYLSDPLINYTLEGQEHLGNTNGVKYYNSRSIYILDKENKVLNKCPKYGELCDPRKIDIDLKNITQSESKYLKNIQ
jgi:hypothetical protein